jgi:hypothetical protein
MGPFRRRLGLDDLTTAGTQPVVPSVPALKGTIATEAGRRSGIRRVWCGFLPWTSRGSLAHGGPQGKRVDMSKVFSPSLSYKPKNFHKKIAI